MVLEHLPWTGQGSAHGSRDSVPETQWHPSEGALVCTCERGKVEDGGGGECGLLVSNFGESVFIHQFCPGTLSTRETVSTIPGLKPNA